MNNLFDDIFEVSDTASLLDKFLNENMLAIDEFYNSNYTSIQLAKGSIEKFILFKKDIISQLDFSKSHAKSFVLMLLNFCERFNFISATPQICSILTQNNISINSRLQAALLFLYPKPKTNSELVDKFDAICEKLQFAIEQEEDNDSKSIATFLNYYGIVVNDTSLNYAEQVKNKIITAIQNETYTFFKNDNLARIADIALSDLAVAYTQIQNVIDIVLGREEVFVYVPNVHTDEDNTSQNFIIETNTDYAREIMSVPNNFNSIRSISVQHAGAQKISGRGVTILESEEELFGYLKSFGNMHQAKLLSAFKALPNNFKSNIRIIDWGCGQGLASMVFFDKYSRSNVNHITLIEPSEIALKRAALHCRKYCSETPLKTICKKLDDLTINDFNLCQSDVVTIHLFSNILDIDSYSQRHLIELIEKTQTGSNYFVCVSPYIDAIKSDRVDSFARYFSKYETFEMLEKADDTKSSHWYCNDLYKDYKKECDCCGSNCWTREMRIFKVTL